MSWIGNWLGGDSGGGGGGTGSIISHNDITGRWDPVIARVKIVNAAVYVVYEPDITSGVASGVADVAQQIFNGTKFNAFWADRSTFVDEGAGEFTLTLLPNGGWQRKDFTLRLIDGSELS